MMRTFFAILFLTCGVFLGTSVAQQTAAPKNVPVSGEVAAVNAAQNQLTIAGAGGVMNVVIDAKTEFKRIAPDKLSDPSSAVPSSLAEFSIGDKVVAIGVVAEDKKSINPTRRVFLVTKDDLAKKAEADREKWTTRGVAGRVTATNAANNEVTIALRGGAAGGERTVIVAANDKTKFRRYAPNSVKYSEALSSSLVEIKAGDQLRAYGEKSSDGAKLTAEEVVFGSFRMVAGKIEKIDAARGEIVIKDVQTDKPVTIAVGSETLLRRFPPEMAQRMAQMQAMRAAGALTPGQGTGTGGQQRPTPLAGQTPPQGGINGGGMRGGDVDAMLERMPALTLGELKIGDAVAASSSVGATPDRVMAIKFVAGIEPFLIAPQTPGGGNRPQASPQINIPGLDGFGAP